MQPSLIVIPAFNEELTIENIIFDLKEHGFTHILIVDDASTDKTYQLAQASGVTVISLPFNLGAWKATQAGIRYAKEHGYKRVITFDADGQHLASTLHKLIAEQRKTKADVVIGSCLARGSVARHIAWKLFKIMSGVSVQDITSGLRLYSEKAIDVLSQKEATILEYQDVGVLLMLRSYRLKKVEVAVEMEKRTSGISRIFNSWLAVSYYMAYTSMLCVSKINKNNNKNNNKNAKSV